jgi:hypothetical protein
MSEPDWKNFAKAVLADWPTGDLEGSVLFDLALEYGMIKEVPGGYNSDHHIDADSICPEEGDPWYEYTFRGEAGPGLYSISALTAERDEQIEWVKRLADMQIASEVKLATCEEIGRAFEEDAGQLRAKLAKAVEGLRGVMQHMPDYADTVWQDARATLAEIEGEER